MNKIFILLGFLLIGNIAFSQAVPESTQNLLDQAYRQAAREKKSVFVIFHASWCGWCKKLEASIEDPSCKAFFDKNYIFVHLDVLESNDKKSLENPGAEDLFNKYAGKGSGIPFFLIYDSKGTLMADSKIRAEGVGLDQPGKNMGCPASDDEIAAFIKVLKKTSSISDSDISAISERFKKNRS